MTRAPSTFDSSLESWRAKMEAQRLAPRTISFYVETMHAVATLLREDGRSPMPRDISPDDVDYLLDLTARKNMAVQTRKGYIHAIKKFCLDFGNDRVSMHLLSHRVRWPQDKRPRVDWLDSAQAKTLLGCPKSPLQEIVIHLELCLGLRHIEIIRLRTTDINWGSRYIDVRGKGPIGGNMRSVPFAPGTETVLSHWLHARAMMLSDARTRHPVSASDPPELIVWYKAGYLHPYSEEGYGLDKVVTLPLSEKLGFHFSNHTLRRTFGRALFRAGVAVPVIAKIFGHVSTEVTLRYIGVDLDDMSRAMEVKIYDD